MTRERFIEELEERGLDYMIVGDKIVVTHRGPVYLPSLETLPPGVVFKNGVGVNLPSLETLPPGVVFSNEGDVHLASLIGGGFRKWDGNIEGISPNRLLNKMIELGLFDRR